MILINFNNFYRWTYILNKSRNWYTLKFLFQTFKINFILALNFDILIGFTFILLNLFYIMWFIWNLMGFFFMLYLSFRTTILMINLIVSLQLLTYYRMNIIIRFGNKSTLKFFLLSCWFGIYFRLFHGFSLLPHSSHLFYTHFY